MDERKYLLRYPVGVQRTSHIKVDPLKQADHVWYCLPCWYAKDQQVITCVTSIGPALTFSTTKTRENIIYSLSKLTFPKYPSEKCNFTRLRRGFDRRVPALGLFTGTGSFVGREVERWKQEWT